MIKSKRYTGIYYKELSNNDKSYYITYKENNKKRWLKIGLHSAGIREAYCNNKRNEILTKIRLGEDLPQVAKKNALTLEDVAKKYYDEKEMHNKKNQYMRSRFNLHFDNIKHLPLNKISKEMIVELQKEKSQTLAPKTVNYTIEQLSTLFNYAINNDLFKGSNPCTKVQKAKVDNKRERYLTIKEIQELKEKIKYNDYLYYFVLVSLSTGGRLNTICNIKPKDILEDGRVKLYDFKNESEYFGFLEQNLIKDLKSFIEKYEKKTEDFIFQATTNENYTDRYYRRHLKPILDELFNKGLDTKDTKNRVVIHTLRHTFASHLAINETPIYTIQKLMNHMDIKMTLRYAKLAPDSGSKHVVNFIQNIL